MILVSTQSGMPIPVEEGETEYEQGLAQNTGSSRVPGGNNVNDTDNRYQLPVHVTVN